MHPHLNLHILFSLDLYVTRNICKNNPQCSTNVAKMCLVHPLSPRPPLSSSRDRGIREGESGGAVDFQEFTSSGA